MQFRGCSWIVLLLPLVVPICVAYHTRLHAALQEEAAAYETNTAWTGLAEIEAEDRQFWDEHWNDVEAMLLQLTAMGKAVTEDVSLLQANNKTGNVTLASSTANGHQAGLKLNLNPKSTAELVPALAMLKGLYESGKERIAKLNAREQQSKKRFEEMQERHEARLATIEARFHNGTLSEEFHTNETRDENRMWSYWQRVRERQRHQFHTSLKIQHGTMEKVKTMIEMYEKTIAGKADKAEVKKGLERMGGVVPEVVLLQRNWQTDAAYFRLALAEAREEHRDLEAVKGLQG